MKPQASLQVTIFHNTIIGLHDFFYVTYFQAKYKTSFYLVIVVYFEKTLKYYHLYNSQV